MFIRTQHEIPLLRQQRKLIEIAKIFRSHPTCAEHKLWQYLRSRRFERLKFRRQHPLFQYIVDFYCYELKLIVEVDGEIHDYQISRDQSREHFLKQYGHTILRFKNEQVLGHITDVLAQIKQIIPLLKKERDGPNEMRDRERCSHNIRK